VSQVKARQNKLAKINSGIEGWVDRLFSFIAPAPIQPAEIARRLESAMEDGAFLERAGHWLAPNIYDLNLSIKDHQRLSPSQAVLIKGWQDSLINYAKRKHYVLKTVPIIRLHGDSKLRLGLVQIDAKLEDARSMSTETSAVAGISETQELNPEQLALFRAQLLQGQVPPGTASSPNQQRPQIGNPGQGPNNFLPPTYPVPSATPRSMPLMPWARLVISLPQGGQQSYQIEKPEIAIGRQLRNDIIVEDKRVSRDHAKILYGPDGQFTIVDLSSTNGIAVNGRLVTSHPNSNIRQQVLHNGDRFTIGSYEFYFERR
jgi:hypothetical protein